MKKLMLLFVIYILVITSCSSSSENKELINNSNIYKIINLENILKMAENFNNLKYSFLDSTNFEKHFDIDKYLQYLSQKKELFPHESDFVANIFTLRMHSFDNPKLYDLVFDEISEDIIRNSGDVFTAIFLIRYTKQRETVKEGYSVIFIEKLIEEIVNRYEVDVDFEGYLSKSVNYYSDIILNRLVYLHIYKQLIEYYRVVNNKLPNHGFELTDFIKKNNISINNYSDYEYFENKIFYDIKNNEITLGISCKIDENSWQIATLKFIIE